MINGLKKVLKRVGTLALGALFLAGCGAADEEQETVVEDLEDSGEMVFRLSQRLSDGSGVGWYWQDNSGLQPYLLYRPLILENPVTGELDPDLAKEYTISDDGLIYTFEMKDDIFWSDGEEITAEDVKFSVETSYNVSLINGIFPDAFSKIEGVEEFVNDENEEVSGIVIDENTVEFHLEEPYGQFANVLSQFLIFPEHHLSDEDPLHLHTSEFWEDPVTSGMYQVSEINTDNYIEFGRNDYYEGTQPKIDKVLISFINDHVVAVTDEQSYFYSTNNLDEISQLENLEGLKRHEIDMLFYRYFVVNLAGHRGEGNAILEDRDVREALMYAIDRESLAESILQNTATVLNAGVPTNLDEYNNELNEYSYDPERAIEMLEEADYDFSRPLKIIYYYTDQNSVDFMQAISYQLSEIGIENELTQVESDATTALFQTRDYDLALKGLSSFGYESWYGEYSSNNTNFMNIYGGIDSFDGLVNDLSATVDEDERQEIINDLQMLEQEELLKLPLFTMQNYIYINDGKVNVPEDFEFNNPFYLYDYRFEEWEVN